MKFYSNEGKYHALEITPSGIVLKDTMIDGGGNTWWQDPHETKEQSQDHAIENKHNLDAFIFIFKSDNKGNLSTLQSISIPELEGYYNPFWSMESTYLDINQTIQKHEG